MKTKKMSMIDVVLISTVVLASAVVFAAVRYNFHSQAVPAFEYGEELLVYPASNVQAKVQSKPQAKTEVAPAPKAALVPLPIIPPRVVFQALPEYPSSALAEGLEGKVLLSVFVSKSGDTGKVEVATSSGVTDIDNAAVSAVSQWKFEAATQGGAAVESWYKVPVTFKIAK